MGTWYSVQGSVKVRDTKKSRAVFKKLDDEIGGDDFVITLEEHKGEKQFTVEINGGMECSHSTVGAIDSILDEFGPFAVEAGYFATECDGEDSDVWVGPDDMVEKAKRAALVREARDALKKLTEKEAEALLLEASDPHFWID